MLLDSFKSLSPDVPLGTNVFEISDTRFVAFFYKSTRADIVFHHITNQMERAFIDFFRPNTLLNLQMGETMSDHGIDVLCENIFAKFHTKLFMNLDQDTETPDPKISKTVKDMFDDWWKYGRDDLRKNYNPPPTETFVTSTVSQALPKQLKGMTLAVVCGEEPPAETMKDGAPFFSGERQTSKFVKDILESMGHLETDQPLSSIRSLYDLMGLTSYTAYSNLEGTAYKNPK
jgi:hypothetical protein